MCGEIVGVITDDDTARQTAPLAMQYMLEGQRLSDAATFGRARSEARTCMPRSFRRVCGHIHFI